MPFAEPFGSQGPRFVVYFPICSEPILGLGPDRRSPKNRRIQAAYPSNSPQLPLRVQASPLQGGAPRKLRILSAQPWKDTRRLKKSSSHGGSMPYIICTPPAEPWDPPPSNSSLLDRQAPLDELLACLKHAFSHPPRCVQHLLPVC